MLLPQHFTPPEASAQLNEPDLDVEIFVACRFQAVEPVNAPVAVLNVTPDGSVPVYEYDVGDPVTVGDSTCDDPDSENAVEL